MGAILTQGCSDNGSAAVYSGAPEGARAIDLALREAGLTTSVNLLVPDARQGL